jgi:hypothetical protein
VLPSGNVVDVDGRAIDGKLFLRTVIGYGGGNRPRKLSLDAMSRTKTRIYQDTIDNNRNWTIVVKSIVVFISRCVVFNTIDEISTRKENRSISPLIFSMLIMKY